MSGALQNNRPPCAKACAVTPDEAVREHILIAIIGFRETAPANRQSLLMPSTDDAAMLMIRFHIWRTPSS